jgi:DNA gyrase subunit A
MNMVALIDGQPKLLNLKQFLDAFLRHRCEVVTRRTIFDLRKARDRGHVLEGLAVALSNVDEIIALIKAAATPAIAKQSLMAKSWRSALVEELLGKVSEASRPEGLAPEFGMSGQGKQRAYRLSDVQAQAILELRLQRLTGLEQDKIVSEYREVMDRIIDLLDILAKSERVTQIISDELVAIKAQYSDKRRSEIVTHTQDMSMEDLIAPEDVVVTMSHGGYMKAQPLAEYVAQKRGGRGKQAAPPKEDDFVDSLFIANTHDYILCFSSRGRVYWIKVYDVPQGTRTARGRPIVNLLPLEGDEKINAILSVKKFSEDQYVFFATANGTVKKTALSDFSNPRKTGIIAINLDEGDYLIGVALTDGKHDVMMFSDGGKAVRFDENDVRCVGRASRGVRGMKLAAKQHVIALLVAVDESQAVLTATENGYGKRTPISEYTRHGRGTQGMIAIQTSARNGKVVAATLVNQDDEIMLIGTNGVMIRTRVKEIREMSRSTQGVTLINLGKNDKLAGLSRIADPEPDGAAD